MRTSLRRLVVLGFLPGILSPLALATTYTVTAGSASDLQSKMNGAVAGDTIQVPYATYTTAFLSNQSGGAGTSSSKVTVVGTGSSRPIFDFNWSKSSSKSGLELVKNYWNFQKLELKHSATTGINIYASGTTLFGLYAHNNWNTNIQIYGGNSSYSPASNTVQYCDSYYAAYADSNTALADYGSGTNVGNADGFTCKFAYIGSGNAFTGCRGYYNGDDGWDFWAAPQKITVTNCIAYRNGYFSNNSSSGGDGNGIKMGGDGSTPEKHTVSNCIASTNRNNGFDYNGTPTSGETLSQNTGYSNGARNFRLSDASVSLSYTLTNNLSVLGASADNPPVAGSGNVWENNSYTASVFTSTSVSLVTRNADWSLTYGNYLKPTSASGLTGKGASL
ncbi:MAG: hypothetical protein HYV96_05070 [Opitutae bacterium]|nr:hypothetical protein [Opitutae bacterium]